MLMNCFYLKKYKKKKKYHLCLLMFQSESTTPVPFTCVALRSSSSPSLSPYPAPGGPTVLPAGENNAKQTTVANGQMSSAVSLWHMSRDVPPRFRNHQEPKILLKRGQSLDGISPFLHTGDQSNANTSQRSGEPIRYDVHLLYYALKYHFLGKATLISLKSGI